MRYTVKIRLSHWAARRRIAGSSDILIIRNFFFKVARRAMNLYIRPTVRHSVDLPLDPPLFRVEEATIGP